MIGLLHSLPLIFAVSLGISVLLYLIGKIISPKSKKTKGKLAPYACGEELPPRKIQVNVRSFFLYVTYFMIFDVSAFLLAMSFSIQAPYPAFFGILIILALVWLPMAWRRKDKRV
jgi:NADH:ubiquinone oxidoreductase subunit 3 (subunit A)